QNMKDDGQHMWRLKHFNRPVYCNVCETLLLGLRKQGLFCKFTAHERCARRAPLSCISTYAKSRKDTSVKPRSPDSQPSPTPLKPRCPGSLPPPSLPRPASATSVRRRSRSFQSLTGLHCVWCHLKVGCDTPLPGAPVALPGAGGSFRGGGVRACAALTPISPRSTRSASPACPRPVTAGPCGTTSCPLRPSTPWCW
uniref:Diacylglycerol kinase alpha n=1 Tax=Gopherus evgoodei TaxID=1825980 RepID=A0A8C4W430_9SAUR